MLLPTSRGRFTLTRRHQTKHLKRAELKQLPKKKRKEKKKKWKFPEEEPNINMEPEIHNESATDASDGDESVSFSQVTAVVTGWTLDFMFVSLCRSFREGKLEEFNETLSAFEGEF